MTERRALIQDALKLPTDAIGYALNDTICQLYEGKYVMRTLDLSFDLDTFLARTENAFLVNEHPRPEWQATWMGPGNGVMTRLAQGHRTIHWNGEDFEVIEVMWTHGYSPTTTMWWIGSTRAAVEAFACQVAEVANELSGEVLVFADGCWQRSKRLRKAIEQVTFDDLVLPEGMADQMLRDFRSFLAAREEYQRYHAPWKRGVLLLGPPGNGKTHCVKALINALDLPCLYVQSFEAPHQSPQALMNEVFRRARRTTPCALVLEDLDALVTPHTRSYFLNELDGFADNAGIVTIATTNHPERLDPAILNRPSRFDRKYHFGLPERKERVVYFAVWREKLGSEIALSDEDVTGLAEATDGFSYAYVKETMLSTLSAWMSAERREAFASLARVQVEALREQMKSPEPEAVAEYVQSVEAAAHAAAAKIRKQFRR
ncbi:MAG: ATP-binding protein [Myxococcota bacterium]